MKKKILIIILVIVVLVSAGVVYLNDVVLPLKVKALLVQGLAEQTQKKVSLESLHFNIFKGMVFKNLVIYDDKEILISLKEGSCIFLMVPLFKKTLVIPVLSLRSPQIFLQRRKDNTYNLADLFLPKKGASAKQGFRVYIYKVGIDDARLRFRDETLPQPFEKEAQGLDLNLYLSLPDRVKFNLRGDLRANPLIHVLAAGAWRISSGELTARVSLSNLSPKEFSAYYQQTGLFIPEGIIEALADVQGRREAVQFDLSLGTKNLLVMRQGVSAKIASSIKATLRYGLKDKSFKYSGKAQLAGSTISGLGALGEVKNINGDFVFSDSEISSEKLTADLFDVPVEAKLKLSGFPAKPLFDLSVNSGLSLAALKSILKDNFKFNIPAALTGDSQVFFSMHTTIPPGLASQVRGYVDIVNAAVIPEKMSVPVQEINGRVEFSLNRAQWRDLSLKYAGAAYKTSGTLNNFAAPQLDITLSSADISLAAKFAVNNKLITLSKLSGRRFNSDFAIEGTIDTADLPKVRTELTGGINLDLQDLKIYFPKFRKQLEAARPAGLVNTQFNLKGDINDFRSCSISARLNSPSVSAWGLKFQDFVLNYDQQRGLIDIPVLQCSFYDGMIKAAAKMNLASDNRPYQVSMDLDGAKLEKLKADTPIKDKDISGTLRLGVKLNGFPDDFSKLSGAGNIAITDGRLWQLDLFKGMSALIFAKDFANITFKEGSCAFFVQDKYVFSDNLKLKSDIAEINGAVKIGFDSSIDATLDVSVKDDMVPLTGTFRDITTAIIGQAVKFGTIKISGTLTEPKFKFKTAVTDIIKTLKDVFLNR